MAATIAANNYYVCPVALMRTTWNPARAKELRILAGFDSVRDVARQINVAHVTILDWEKNKDDGGSVPNYEAVMRLTKLYGVDCNAFRQEVGEPPYMPRRKKKKPDDDE